MAIVIIDSGTGNLRSAAKSFEAALAHLGRHDRVIVSGNVADVLAADRIVLPGQGAFKDCMQSLNALPGMREALEKTVIEQARPFMGICVGMQMLAEKGYEHGVHAGLGWVQGEIHKVETYSPENKEVSLKIPHMGWNDICLKQNHPLFSGLKTGDHLYFVHSYHMRCAPEILLASVSYGSDITAAIGRDNIVATQFHPDKSQQAGIQVISNFLKWRP